MSTPDQTVDARTVPLCSICGQPEANHPKVAGFHTFSTEPASSSSEEETREVHEITPLLQQDLPLDTEGSKS